MNIKINIREMVKSDTFLGFLVIFSFIFALLVCNLGIFGDYYNSFVFAPISIKFGDWSVDTILINLVNDGIMSFFFLLIGLEMKYHLTVGEYVDKEKLILPTAAAIGGIACPALIFFLFNYDQLTVKGWAITIASDTAFMIALLSFFKGHISSKLRAFIIVFSLIDDGFALIILAFFYSQKINLIFLLMSFLLCGVMAFINYLNIRKVTVYILLGFLLWITMVEAGVHGTLSGVIVALFIPVKCANHQVNNYYVEFEHKLQHIVNFYIVPGFIFINSGIVISDFSLNSFFSNLSIGIILGLFIGKQLGIFGFSYLATKLKLCSFPKDTSVIKYYAVSVLGGVGFTLSFFIGGIAFEVEELDNIIRASIIVGSLLSALWGMMVLKWSIIREKQG